MRAVQHALLRTLVALRGRAVRGSTVAGFFHHVLLAALLRIVGWTPFVTA